MGGVGAAAAIAVINCTGNLAGFVSPYVIGFLKDTTGTLLPGMIVLACALVLAAVIVLAMPVTRKTA
jgi:nitrate/nitrite transporter NarK